MTKRIQRYHVSFERANGASQHFAVEEYPAILTADQAAKLLQIPRKTLYVWLAAGRLGSAARKRGRRWFFWRDALVNQIFNGAEW